ncbi:glycoside hydrolase domain-containing protein [Kitasatospora azatica]|uniref:glycoside hydrolase domain-containing protein n=1 Tax=Kitasatospora azatica TaxID=58347 RepID=UPI00068FDE59|nr:glycoside hydrolase domain-containing protein [Kitasatospora azatica]
MSKRLASSTAVILLATGGLSAVAPGAQAADSTRTVDYRGYHLQVPADWQVVDLAQNPHTCVRFDQHAVYLGTPGEQQNCPAHLVAGRTDAFLIQPAPAPTASRPAAPLVDPGTAVLPGIVDAGASSREINVQLRGTGLQLTASYGDSAQTVNTILAAAGYTRTGAAAPAAAPLAAPAAPAATVAGATTSSTVAPSTDDVAKGFDACSAPSDNLMSAWMANSPYRSVGIYIGGPAQSCAAGVLDAGWVGRQAQSGWSFLPIYVGHQANANISLQISTDLPTAAQQGTDEASDALGKAAALGFPAGSVIYNDMENYSSSTSSARVLAYLNAWTARIKQGGYRSGVYSGPYSGLSDLSSQYNNGSFARPDVVWSAAWNSHQDTGDAGTGLSAGYWPGARRAHQYANTTESYGGYSLNIDADAVTVASTASGNSMAPGQRLEGGQSLNSASVSLTMQTDGDLVVSLKVGGSAAQPVLWRSGTGGNSGAYLVMQRDGNLVIYRADGVAIWSTYSSGRPGSWLSVQDDGNVVLYGSNGGPIWSTDAYRVPSTFTAGQGLKPGRWTESALIRVVVQQDGNLVIYRKRDGAVLWTPNTWGNPGAYLTMQADGNLVLYRQGGGPSSGGALWSSNTWGNSGAYALTQDDGNFVVYRQGGGPSSGGALWATNTYGNAS